MSMPGPFELIIIFLVILLIFGAKRIPEIAQGVGKGIREFKNATRDIQREIQLDDSQNRIQQPRAPQQTNAPRGSYQPTENTGQGS